MVFLVFTYYHLSQQSALPRVSRSAPTAFYLVPQLSSSTLVCIPCRHCKCLKRHTCLCGPCAYSPGKSRILKVKSEAHHRLAGTLLTDHPTVCSCLHSLLFLKLFLSLGFPSLNVVCHPIQLKSHFICDVDLVSSWVVRYSRTCLLCSGFTLCSL